MHDVESPRYDDNALEAEIVRKGCTAPRITREAMEASISSTHYFTAAQGALGAGALLEEVPSPLGLLTLCVLVLKNGFTVLGESACASPENFDAEIGRKAAREHAVNKMWPLLGYALRNELARNGH